MKEKSVLMLNCGMEGKCAILIGQTVLVSGLSSKSVILMAREPDGAKERAVEVVSWFVYMLQCKDGSLYTGYTDDVQRRLAVHSAGKGAKYTRSRLPVELVYQEELPDKSAALRREAAIKKLTRRQKLDLIEGQPCRMISDNHQK